jgi:hypothetical protein
MENPRHPVIVYGAVTTHVPVVVGKNSWNVVSDSGRKSMPKMRLFITILKIKVLKYFLL